MTVARSTSAPCAHPGTPLAGIRAGIDACVHCGFCLQACPTYLTLEDENDSPRGRILLMRAASEGTLALDDPALRTHTDRCLGCRACETACPSGVPYGAMLEATRATMRLERRGPLLVRLILAVFARQWLLRIAMAAGRLARGSGLAQLLARAPGRMGLAMAMVTATRPLPRQRRYTAHGTGARGSVAMLRGCVMQGMFAETNAATERVLITNDYSMADAPGQRCCGALHAHAGDLETARALARANIEAFEQSGAQSIAVNAAGCGAMMKEYHHLLHDDPAWAGRARAMADRVRDISELLASAGPVRGPGSSDAVAYDAPCHLLHAQRVAAPPQAVLDALVGQPQVTLDGAEHCCGSAGLYNLVEPGTSASVLAPKLEAIERSGAMLVATGNPGCLMQIGAGLHRAGMRARAVHPVDLLDAAYARRDADGGTAG
jgi:glycolate oxidase iron-sulfur subunit